MKMRIIHIFEISRPKYLRTAEMNVVDVFFNLCIHCCMLGEFCKFGQSVCIAPISVKYLSWFKSILTCRVGIKMKYRNPACQIALLVTNFIDIVLFVETVLCLRMYRSIYCKQSCRFSFYHHRPTWTGVLQGVYKTTKAHFSRAIYIDWITAVETIG